MFSPVRVGRIWCVLVYACLSVLGIAEAVCCCFVHKASSGRFTQSKLSERMKTETPQNVSSLPRSVSSLLQHSRDGSVIQTEGRACSEWETMIETEWGRDGERERQGGRIMLAAVLLVCAVTPESVWAADWGLAGRTFRAMKGEGSVCVNNLSLAYSHHTET